MTGNAEAQTQIHVDGRARSNPFINIALGMRSARVGSGVARQLNAVSALASSNAGRRCTARSVTQLLLAPRGAVGLKPGWQQEGLAFCGRGQQQVEVQSPAE